mgnify:CR=1 FL=1
MAHLYHIKNHGWRIKYRVYFPDGTHKDKIRLFQKKAVAQLVLKDAAELESRSRARSLSNSELLFFLNQKFMARDEADRLSSKPLSVSMTWNELVKNYEDWSRANCRPATHAGNCSKLNQVISFFKDVSPSDVGAKEVEGFLQKRLAEVKAATVRKELTVLRKLLDRLGGENPARKMAQPKIKERRIPRAFYPEELAVFLKALEKRKRFLRGYLVPATMTYLCAGLRPSEIVRLTSEDVRGERILVHGETKTGEARSVEVHPALLPHIRACKKRGGPWLFGGKKQLIANSLGREIRRTIKSVGLTGVTPYSLRHTFISALLRESGDIRYTMDKAGHRQLSTTLGYLHVLPSKNSPIKKIDFGKG